MEKKTAQKILAGVMAALMVFGVVAGAIMLFL